MAYDIDACRLEHLKQMSDLELKIQKVADENVSILKSLNKQSQLVDNIQELSISVSLLANNMKSMLEVQEKQTARIDQLEQKPAKRWETLVSQIIMLIVGGIVGFLLMKAGLSV